LLVKSARVRNKSPRLAAEAPSLLPGYRLSQETYLAQATKVFISSQGLLEAFPNREVIHVTSPTALLTETLDLWPNNGFHASKAETCRLFGSCVELLLALNDCTSKASEKQLLEKLKNIQKYL
jgi:hypothetical protein